MTEEKKPSSSSTADSAKNVALNTDKISPANKAASVNSSKTLNAKSTSTAKTTKTPMSKLAIIAFIFALIAIAGTVIHYFWLQQQTVVTQQNNSEAQQRVVAQMRAGVKTTLQQQAKVNQQKMNEIVQRLQTESNARIEHLSATINQLTQKQPSDWLVQEAEYLIRVAARTMWLSQDTTAAVGLLTDANSRLNELNDPKYLSVRQVIYQDIEALKLMPKLATDDVIMSLMALTQQVNTLPLAMVNIPDSSETEASLALTNDTADWQENLSKTWHKFLNEFITVRRRSGSVEPLMSPQHQQNLKQNLALKIQLAIWAASEKKQAVYSQSLADIQQWQSQYFDMEAPINQAFNQQIENLKAKVITFDYPSTLASLDALHSALKNNTKIEVAPTVEKTQTDLQTSPQALPEKEMVDDNKNTGDII